MSHPSADPVRRRSWWIDAAVAAVVLAVVVAGVLALDRGDGDEDAAPSPSAREANGAGAGATDDPGDSVAAGSTTTFTIAVTASSGTAPGVTTEPAPGTSPDPSSDPSGPDPPDDPDPAGEPTTTAPAPVSPDDRPPDGSGGTTTTTAVPVEPQGVCGAYDVIEEAVALVFNSGDLSEADLVEGSHRLASRLEEAVGLLRSNASELYGPDAVVFADFLASLVDDFATAATTADVDAAGKLIFEPPNDVSESDNRLQDEYDASCEQ